MKTCLLLFFAFLSTFSSFAQDLIVKSSYENTYYVESIAWHGNDIYCAGLTFQTKINDGNSSDAYLVNYDTTLKMKWCDTAA